MTPPLPRPAAYPIAIAQGKSDLTSRLVSQTLRAMPPDRLSPLMENSKDAPDALPTTRRMGIHVGASTKKRYPSSFRADNDSMGLNAFRLTSLLKRCGAPPSQRGSGAPATWLTPPHSGAAN